jgi:hypothetical protein
MMSLQEWLYSICATESPSVQIVAYNFGLYETQEGYSIYLTGSKIFNTSDDDWSTNIDFEPNIKYLALNINEYKSLKWEDVLEKVKFQLFKFIKTDQFKNSFFRYAKAITVGFDDGDLHRIK